MVIACPMCITVIQCMPSSGHVSIQVTTVFSVLRADDVDVQFPASAMFNMYQPTWSTLRDDVVDYRFPTCRNLFVIESSIRKTE